MNAEDKEQNILLNSSQESDHQKWYKLKLTGVKTKSCHIYACDDQVFFWGGGGKVTIRSFN